MAIKSSTGLAAALITTSDLKTIFDGGLIKFYDGTEPATADAAVAGSLLWTVSVGGDGTGLTFENTPSGRAMVKTVAESWSGATTAGTVTYWRLVAAGDDGTLSTTQARVQGNCGSTAGSDMYMSSTTLVTNASLTAKSISAFSVGIPTN